MSLDAVLSLANRANQAQIKATEASCFEELMTQIIQAYRLEQASSRIVYSEDSVRLKQDVDFWQQMIDVSNAAIGANKEAWVKAQASNNPETVMEEALDDFINQHNPGFEIYISNGDWWADVAY